MEIAAIIINVFGLVIEYIGLAIVVISAIIALVHMVIKKYDIIKIRSEFAQNVMFGLEFIIAADILLVTIAHNNDEIIKLGGIVIIRILLGYTLRKEMIGAKKKRFSFFRKK